MDASTLRLILIGLGVLVIAGILLFGSPERQKHRHASRKQRMLEQREGDADLNDDEAAVQQELKALGELIAQDRDGDNTEAGETAASKPKPPAPNPDKIVSLYIQTREKRVITGVQLLDAALKTGMEFGEMDIFHRLQTVDSGEQRSVFSMANMVKPGHFDKTAWNTFETQGVTLFLMLPGPMAGLDAWDTMLATGQRLAELLNAELFAGDGNPVSRENIARIRDELREYDRRMILKNLSE